MNLPRQQIDVILDHVEPALRRRQSGDPVHPNHPAPPRGKWQGMEEAAWAAVLRFHPLARLARADILGDVKVLPHPEGKATNQRPRLGPSKVPPDRPIMALAQHLGPQAPARRDAQPVR